MLLGSVPAPPVPASCRHQPPQIVSKRYGFSKTRKYPQPLVFLVGGWWTLSPNPGTFGGSVARVLPRNPARRQSPRPREMADALHLLGAGSGEKLLGASEFHKERPSVWLKDFHLLKKVFGLLGGLSKWKKMVCIPLVAVLLGPLCHQCVQEEM